MYHYEVSGVFALNVLLYLLFLIEALLVTVWYAETSGVENVCNLEAAENALNLSPTGTLHMREHISSYCTFSNTSTSLARGLRNLNAADAVSTSYFLPQSDFVMNSLGLWIKTLAKLTHAASHCFAVMPKQWWLQYERGDGCEMNSSDRLVEA